MLACMIIMLHRMFTYIIHCDILCYVLHNSCLVLLLILLTILKWAKCSQSGCQCVIWECFISHFLNNYGSINFTSCPLTNPNITILPILNLLEKSKALFVSVELDIESIFRWLVCLMLLIKYFLISVLLLISKNRMHSVSSTLLFCTC